MSSIHFHWSSETNSNEVLPGMLSASDYWQPDNESLWVNGQSGPGVAKAQLFNTQRSKGDEVFYDHSLGLAITANARIDNRDTLLCGLALAPNKTQLDTDSQLILQAYAKWREDCVQHLRGDFVFIIWDQKARKVFCARDHFGVKTLFYSEKPEGIMLTNEHKAFFTSGWESHQHVEDDWLACAMWGLTPTAFDSPNPHIHVLPPAHTLEFDTRGVRTQCYWHLQPQSRWNAFSDEEWLSELSRRFHRAVAVRLDSEYPLGLELSEGIDSNGVAGSAATQRAAEKFFTFSYNCNAINKNNAAVWADTYADIDAMLALHPNLEAAWQHEPPSNQQLRNFQDKAYFYQHFGGVVPCYGKDFVRSRLAQTSGVRAMLSGWGGDHCVSSNGDQYVDELFCRCKFVAAFRILSAQFQRGRGSAPLKSFSALILRNTVPSIWALLASNRMGLGAAIWQRAKTHFINDHWRQTLKLNTHLRRHLQNFQCRSVRQKQQFELFGLGLTKYMTESELTGRLSRVEYRFPMLDVDLVEFAHSMPSHLGMYRGIERYAFRRVLGGLTTERIQWRRKADVNHPKRNKQQDLANHRAVIRQHLRDGTLIGRFSSEKRFSQCLQQDDPNLLRSLELLAHADAYYFSQPAPPGDNSGDARSASKTVNMESISWT